MARSAQACGVVGAPAGPAPSPASRPERARARGVSHALTPCDRLYDLVDGMIRAGGGRGCLCQLRLRLLRPVADHQAVRTAWAGLGERVWTLGATLRGSHWARRWTTRAPARLILEVKPAALSRLADAHLYRGLDPERGGNLRLALADDETEPGAVLTWDHRLFDARAALGVLADLAAATTGGTSAVDDWRGRDYRVDPRLPRGRLDTARLALGGISLLRAQRGRALLQPRGAGVTAAPLRTASLALGPEATARVDARQRAATGAFNASAFLFACVAGALEAAYGIGGDILVQCAVDHRTRSAPQRFANCHGGLMLSIPGGMASRDLAEAGRGFVAAHHAWLAAHGPEKLAAILACLRWTRGRFARRQLGLGRPGVAASCTVANTGRCPLSGTWFGAEVAGVDHVAAIPGSPGLGVLFHRDVRGLVVDVIATGAVGELMPPERFAQLLRHQLVDRPFAGALQVEA